MRRTTTVVLAAAIATIAALAVYDAVRGSSSPGESTTRTEATETLGVVSTPASVPKWPRVLRRTIRLERAVGTAWEEFGVLDPGSYDLTARIELPRKADVDVWIEGTTGTEGADILGRGAGRNCEPRRGRDVCLTGVDFVQDSGQPMRLLARKLSLGRMLIHLRIEFEKTSTS